MSDENTRGSGVLPEKITSDGMQECRVSMEQTTARLEKHMQDVLDRIVAKSNRATTQDDTAFLAKLQEEWTTARQCRDICFKADQHLKENISVIDNHATGDETVQFLVSSSQKTIHGKNRGYGVQIKQLGGHLSDQSIQKISGDFLKMTLRKPGNDNTSSQDDKLSEFNDANEGTDWQPQYGSGRTLNPRLDPDPTIGQKFSGETGSERARGT